MKPRSIAPLDAPFWLWHGAVPLLLFVFAATACEITHMDLVLADRFYDFAAGNWPARQSWWAEWLIHKRGRDLVAVTASLSFIAWILSFQVPRLRPFRWAALYLVLAIGLGTGLVTLGKDMTGRHCPWSMERYGGSVPYTRLLEGNPPGEKKGRCFPAGHAAGGFSLMGIYFALRDRRITIARAGLAAGLALGTIYGYAQMARGAHFLSHTVWSAGICWSAALGLYLGLRRFLPSRNHETEPRQQTIDEKLPQTELS
ncbi:phosphatase PAP2 family protein [Geobacter sp.]|uniref:phosphatase PAP2 family protein n=1 Tax=Geobacter sp. TaxID=46610 RepID=UPI0027B91C37|nr:phosphatase PAP2 family protein [Geobacter sp.]